MKKVLILDDERELLDLWIAHFKMWKMDVELFTGASGLDGLKLLAEHKKFDLIITDFKMPGMDGLDFVKAVRTEDRNTPICFFTGYLPELAFLASDMDKVLLFEKPMISQKMRMYITICLSPVTPAKARSSCSHS